METVGTSNRRGELPAFVVLAFGFSWPVWLAGPAIGSPTLARLLGAFGPSLAGVAVVAATGGTASLRGLLSGLGRWNVRLRWYGFALGFPALVSLVGTIAWVGLGGSVPDFANPPVVELYPIPPGLADIGPWPLLPLVFVQTLLLGSPMGEEIGWRGFALPRLQATRGALGASLVLGVVWGVWHLPLWLSPTDPTSGTFVGWLFAGIVADAVLFTWLFNNTDGSLLLAVLFHATITVTGLFLAGPDVPWLAPLVKWLAVVIVLQWFDRETLTRRSSSTRIASVIDGRR